MPGLVATFTGTAATQGGGRGSALPFNAVSGSTGGWTAHRGALVRAGEVGAGERACPGAVSGAALQNDWLVIQRDWSIFQDNWVAIQKDWVVIDNKPRTSVRACPHGSNLVNIYFQFGKQ